MVKDLTCCNVEYNGFTHTTAEEGLEVSRQMFFVAELKALQLLEVL